MADNLSVTPGTGATIGMDEVTDGTLGSVKVGFGKIMDGTLNSTNKLIVNSSGEAKVKATDSDALLTTIDADTSTIAGAVAGSEMQVDVVTSALPTGAATLAEQQTQTTALQLIDDAVYTDGTGTVTKGIAILGQDGTNPQAIKTDASGELQVDVLTMPTVAVTQSGTWDEVGINDSGNSITVDDGGTSLTVDGTVAATQSGTWTLGANSGVDIGDVTINNASGGSAVNIQDGGNSITVDNGGTFAVQSTEVRPSSATVTSVASSATSVSILASNSSRRGATFFNDADKICYLKFGTTASTTSFTLKIFANGFFSMPFPTYTGAIDAIWESSPTGSLRITEF